MVSNLYKRFISSIFISSFCKRFISSVFIFLLFFACGLFSYNGYNLPFYILISLIIAASSIEWSSMTKNDPLMLPIAFFVLVLPNASILFIYSMSQGMKILAWLLCSIWAVDVFAYVIGKLYGGYKLLPSVSPNKTWSGLIGAILGSVIVSVFFSLYNGLFKFFDSIIIGAVIAILAQFGDLAESFLKRVCKVKDSGTCIPGHGGVLDRVDGFIFVAPFVLCFIEKFLYVK